MRAGRIAAVVLRQFYLLRGSPTRVLPMFSWVAIDIVLWGFITRYLNTFATGGFNFVPALLGAVLLWGFLTRVMQGVTQAFFEDVWSRNFLNVFATPLMISEYVIGLVVIGVCTSLVGLVVMLVLATLVFGLSMFAYGLAIIPFMMVLFLTGIALGVASSAVVLRLGPASEWMIWPIPSLISPFVGVFYPLSVLPGWMQAVSRVLPPSYVFEGMRAVVAGHGVQADHLLWGAGLSLVYVALAGVFFASIYRYAIRTGLIARYSAETVT